MLPRVVAIAYIEGGKKDFAQNDMVCDMLALPSDVCDGGLKMDLESETFAQESAHELSFESQLVVSEYDLLLDPLPAGMLGPLRSIRPYLRRDFAGTMN
jgi:hypothetical protein